VRRRKEEGEEEKRRIGNQELETLLQKPEASKVHQRKLVQNQVRPKPSSSKTKFVQGKQGQARASKGKQEHTEQPTSNKNSAKRRTEARALPALPALPSHLIVVQQSYCPNAHLSHLHIPSLLPPPLLPPRSPRHGSVVVQRGEGVVVSGEGQGCVGVGGFGVEGEGVEDIDI